MIPVQFHWARWKEGDLRFVTHRYRCGGPWRVRYVIHDLEERYGFSFRTRKGWRFLGLMKLSNLREVDEVDVTQTEDRP